ncbi:MAG: hypothetical protein PHR16_16300 [Methylovulum sp.]|nr:hypothetical protein [Methylovulum sp.]
MPTKPLRVGLFLLIGIITACASTSNKSNNQSTNDTEVQQVIGNIPANSPFAKIKIGMSSKQVHDLIGEPTDTESYSTGKAFIPFYFGDDVMRTEDLYKGLGRVVYTGAGIGGVNFKVYQIVYDTSEDGYNN